MIPDSEINRTVGQLLAALRRGNGLTQQQVAERMGLKGARYIRRIELGEVAPTLPWLHRYYTALGLHLYLLSLPEDGHCPRAAEAQTALSQLHEQLRQQGQN